jgi:hypothetical protein
MYRFEIMFGACVVWVASSHAARAAQVVADPSDYVALGGSLGGAALSLSTNTQLFIGDTDGSAFPRLSVRPLMKFSLAGISGSIVQSASLTVWIIESRNGGFGFPETITSSPPFVNPGLGDVLVKHIADYGDPVASAYSLPSLGNDPGVLIPSGVEVVANAVSIDVKSAMQQAINSGFSFVTFRLQTAVETDGDDQRDFYFLGSADALQAEQRPTLTFNTVPEPASAALALTLLVCLGAWRRGASIG